MIVCQIRHIKMADTGGFCDKKLKNGLSEVKHWGLMAKGLPSVYPPIYVQQSLCKSLKLVHLQLTHSAGL